MVVVDAEIIIDMGRSEDQDKNIIHGFQIYKLKLSLIGCRLVVDHQIEASISAIKARVCSKVSCIAAELSIPA